jgi:hypothetical protein
VGVYFFPVFYRLSLAVLFLSGIVPSGANAQVWRVATPRDTVTVPANQKTFVTSKIQLTSGVDMWISPSGTFSENDGSTTFGMDGAYTFLINTSSLIPQAINPPTYSGSSHKYALTVTTVPGLNETDFAASENSYQPSHIYTQRYPSQGNKFQYRIIADKDADYPRAAGSLNIKMARWTAGIAMKNFNVSFGNVFIGTPSMILDSLASYGLDPLQIDSIQIVDISGSGDYSFVSEHTSRFTLQTEQTNELRITFSPSSRGLISAELHIYSHNADPLSRMSVIYLSGTGIAPNFGVGPHQWDFGKVRIGYPATAATQISNAIGNTSLTVTNTSKYIQYLPAPAPVAFTFSPQTILPTLITAGSIGEVKTVFSPQAQVKYSATLQLRGNNVQPDSVQFTGEGAQPIPVFSPVSKNGTLDFGIVYNGNNSTRTLTLTNIGNWPLSVIIARITGSSSTVFTFSPPDTEFTLAPDSSKTFTVSFHPGTTIDSLHFKDYFEFVYDDFTIDTVVLTGIEIEPQIVACNHFYDFGKVKIGASKTDSVSCLRNVGNISIQLQEEEVLPPGQFSEIGKIGSIKAHSTVPVICEFKPLTPGPSTAWFYYAANGKRDSVTLTGIGAVAKAIFTPPVLDYGIVPSNHWDTLTTILKDSGDYALRVDSITITGPDAADFHIVWQPNGTTPNPAFTIQPDSSIAIEVRFLTNALTGKVHQARVCVYYDDSTSDCIPLQAIEEKQYLQFGQSSIDFGKQRIKTHTSPQRHVIFNNPANIPLGVGAVTVTSPDNVFFVEFSTLNQIPVQSKDSSVIADFFPIVRGTYTGYLHAFGGDIKTDSIQLRGQGAAPIPKFSDTILDFGIVPLGTPKVDSFTLYNVGDWLLKAVKIELVGVNASDFTYQKAGKIPIADSVDEQQSVTYVVTFTPVKTIVFHTAKIIFTFDDSTQGEVILKGYDESPKLAVDADTINFGKVRLMTTANKGVNIISTSIDTLIAQNMTLFTAAPAGTFITSPTSGPIIVMPRTLYETSYPVNVAFAPPAIGQYTGKIIFSGKNIDTSTVYITGIGASQKPVLSSKLLDFGSLFPGYPATRSFTIADSGNWQIAVTKYLITGPNNADFTLRNIPSQFNILEDSTDNFIVDFRATTQYQAAQRTAQILFTLDDNSTMTIDLIEQDIQPIHVDLVMDNERARIGDVVYPCLRLETDIPDSLNILDLKGVITYDATLFDLDRSGAIVGEALVQLGNWKLIPNAADLPGQFTYELQGTSAPLGKSGPVLRMKFKPHDNDVPGATSPLTNTQFSFPLRNELSPFVVDGTMVVDSTCGNTHLLTGTATANMIDHNMPNPFGGNSGNNETQIPFDIGADNTAVTIRILDVSGKEIARPVDNQIFGQGRYTATVSAASLGSNGTYFYEFRAGNDQPVFMKMMVRK